MTHLPMNYHFKYETEINLEGIDGLEWTIDVVGFFDGEEVYDVDLVLAGIPFDAEVLTEKFPQTAEQIMQYAVDAIIEQAEAEYYDRYGYDDGDY